MGDHPGVEIQDQPDEPDLLDANLYPAMPWGGWFGVGCVECVGLGGGFLAIS